MTFIAGALARVGRDIIIHPLDTLTTRTQKDLEWQWSSMYAGLGPNLLIGVPASGAYFAMNAFMLDACHTHLPQAFDDVGLNMVIAAVAAATIHWIIRTPGEVIKTRAQAEFGGERADVERACAQIRNEGVLSLWTGLRATLYRSIPFEILRLCIYAVLLERLWPNNAFLCGLTAGASAALLTQPLDTVKTRLQTDEAVSTGEWRPSLLEAAMAILGERGGDPRALWAGGVARMVYCAASSAVLFGLFQALLQALTLSDEAQDSAASGILD